MLRKSRRYLVSVVCLAGLAACATKPDGASGLVDGMMNSAAVDAERMIEGARTLVKKQKYDQAQDSFARILRFSGD